MSDINQKNLEIFLKKKLLFQPCKTQDELKRWIKVFLGWDLPDVIVDPDSNSSPMHNIWEMYEAAIKEKSSRMSVLAYASRDSYKTAGSAIMELLCLLHLNRQVCHMAAIESQSKKAQNYIKKFVNTPVINHFLTSKNEREITITRFTHRETGEHLNKNEYLALPIIEQSNYDMYENTCLIIICTLSGVNGPHGNFFTVDELDIIDDLEAWTDSHFIPATFTGKQPIILMTSSRKFAYGLVQQEIDKSSETGVQLRHWNIIDVTEKCPTERHRPDLPKQIIYRSNDLLKAISEDDYNLLDEVTKQKYVKDEGYWGCIKQCSLFAACRGHLANRQTCTSDMLKPIEHVVGLFKTSTLDKAKCQLMSWKPSSEGMIFPRFDKNLHMISAAKMAELLTGESYPEYFTKAQLIGLMKTLQLRFVTGVDWGFTHLFACVTGVVDANRLFVFDVIAKAGLEVNQRVEVCKQVLKPLDPDMWADTAEPASIKTFKLNGFKIRDWEKEKWSVQASIDIIRSKLTPVLNGVPELYLLKDDEECNYLAKEILEYHFRKDTNGRLTEEPDPVKDDRISALRYLCFNIFTSDLRPAVATQAISISANQEVPVYTPQNYIRQKVDEILADNNSNEPIQISRGKLKIIF